MKEAVRELGCLLAPERVLFGEAVERAYDCDAYTVDKSRPPLPALLAQPFLVPPRPTQKETGDATTIQPAKDPLTVN